eukprot:841967-Pelagomonas_calceolata.AAC.4
MEQGSNCWHHGEEAYWEGTLHLAHGTRKQLALWRGGACREKVRVCLCLGHFTIVSEQGEQSMGTGPTVVDHSSYNASTPVLSKRHLLHGAGSRAP